jgi:dTDP-4-dehydrorhamnose reductase
MGALPEGARILLTGGTGQVGGELVQTLAALGEVVAPTRAEMDLTNAESVRDAVRRVKPRWVVNPGAYTAVDKAESEPELAYAVNRDAVRVMGEEAARLGAGVIHFSTDYVFDGSGTRAYVESDATGPVSVYGASKLAGEQALAATGAGHAIFRTSWVYGATGKNFLRTILKLAREREVLTVVGDQHGAPTWSRDLARMATAVVERCEVEAKGGELSEALKRLGGVYHAAGAGETTWHGFAAEAVRLEQEREPEGRFAKMVAITTEEYPTAARRPGNSRMSGERLEKMFGWKMMDWRDSLRAVLAEMAAGAK